MTSVGTTVAKLWPFLYVQDGHQPPSWFYRTTNSAIRSADPENPSLEPNMEWIGCTVCKIFAFKLHCDLETGVRGHSRSLKVTLFDRAHTTLYSSSIVTMPLSSTLSEIQPHIGRKLLVFATPLYLAPPPPCGWSRRIYATTFGGEKLDWWAYQTVKEFRWYVQPFWYNRRVWQPDGRTDGRNWRDIYALYAVARKNALRSGYKLLSHIMLIYCQSHYATSIQQCMLMEGDWIRQREHTRKLHGQKHKGP